MNKEFNLTTWMNSQGYETKKQELFREINSRKLVKISGEAWKKDANERMKLYSLKEKNRRERKEFFGDGKYKKYLNTPEKSLINTIRLLF